MNSIRYCIARDVGKKWRVYDDVKKCFAEPLENASSKREARERASKMNNGDRMSETATCRYCQETITFYKGAWWTGTEFQCVNGEYNHMPMNNFEVAFEARKQGAIGVFSEERRTVEAGDAMEASGKARQLLNSEGYETRNPIRVKPCS